MATPLDTGLLQHFDIIFPFLLVLVGGYALLSNVKLFGEQKGLNAMIAFILAVFVLFSPMVREILVIAAPWYVLLFFFIIFALIAFMSLGATSGDIHNVLMSGEYRYIHFWVIGLILIIGLGSLSTVVANSGGFGSTGSETNITSGDQSAQESDFWSTLVNPKVLGLVLIMLIGMFTIQRLASGN